MITVFLVLILASMVIVGYIAFLKYKMNKVDHDIEVFYKSVDVFRQHIHNCTSDAEAKELDIDLDHLELDFEDRISNVILCKEMDLLRTLLEKKSKKLK